MVYAFISISMLIMVYALNIIDSKELGGRNLAYVFQHT